MTNPEMKYVSEDPGYKVKIFDTVLDNDHRIVKCYVTFVIQMNSKWLVINEEHKYNIFDRILDFQNRLADRYKELVNEHFKVDIVEKLKGTIII